MRRSRFLIVGVFLLLASSLSAQQVDSLSPLVQKYVRVNAPRVVLEHVRVIDGTGGPPAEDRNVVITRFATGDLPENRGQVSHSVSFFR